MALQHVFQIGFIEFGMREQLFDARLVLGAAHAGGNRHDVFGAENSGWHSYGPLPDSRSGVNLRTLPHFPLTLGHKQGVVPPITAFGSVEPSRAGRQT